MIVFADDIDLSQKLAQLCLTFHQNFFDCVFFLVENTPRFEHTSETSFPNYIMLSKKFMKPSRLCQPSGNLTLFPWPIDVIGIDESPLEHWGAQSHIVMILMGYNLKEGMGFWKSSGWSWTKGDYFALFSLLTLHFVIGHQFVFLYFPHELCVTWRFHSYLKEASWFDFFETKFQSFFEKLKRVVCTFFRGFHVLILLYNFRLTEFFHLIFLQTWVFSTSDLILRIYLVCAW